MRTFLVAMVAPDQKTLIDALVAANLTDAEDSAVDCWWIAEDDREDGSNNDSAIFVPRGSQMDYASLRDQHMDHYAEAYREDGYPYADTDVTGTWFHQDAEGEWVRTEPHTYTITEEG